MRHARDTAVEPVQHHRNENRDRGVIEIDIHRLHDRVEAREQRGGREQIGQQIDPAAPDAILENHPLGLKVLHSGERNS